MSALFTLLGVFVAASGFAPKKTEA